MSPFETHIYVIVDQNVGSILTSIATASHLGVTI